MQYEYINYSRYNIDNIYEAFEHESKENFFKICKALKFTINPYPGSHRYAAQIKQLDIWLRTRLSGGENKIWDKLLEESKYINMLYKDLYNDPDYIEANSIDSSKELTSFLVCMEYSLIAIRELMLGNEYLNNQLGSFLKPKKSFEGINNNLLFYGELYDNLSVKIKEILEYIVFYKKNNHVCEKINISDVMKSRGHVAAIMVKNNIDMITESWQFGGINIDCNEKIITCSNNFWGHIIRTYWEMRERSVTTTEAMALEKFPMMEEEKWDIERTKFILQKQLYIDISNCKCKIVHKNKDDVIINILDFVKGFARIKYICQQHLINRNSKIISGNINKVCVQIKKKDLKRNLLQLGIDNAELVLELLTYQKNKDIIDAPLISYGNYYYMIPTLVVSTLISEVVLSMANVFEFRGKELEKCLLRLLKEEGIICGKIKRHENADTYECDSIFILDNNLFLVESKAWGFPGNITQYYNMNDKIIEAGKQLDRLANYITNNLQDVLIELNLEADYRIDNIYRILLSNFQRADEQILDNTFLCDFNTFRGTIKGVPSGVFVAGNDYALTRFSDEPMRESQITCSKLIDFLKNNELLKRTNKLLEKEIFYEPINELYLKQVILKRNIGLITIGDENLEKMIKNQRI
ncbi:hypothetical protein [Lacrimispora sp.]|uniref:hypothetical protein n=1 Tax=Lacrimispora sp. TaxID=2719234 RepID=UPI0028AB759E|nr:hypothetical protein [Lacrimispora sp.]